MRYTPTFLLFAITLFARQPELIEGDYIEYRSNHVFGCYCEWSGEGETSGREVILGWRILSGASGDVDLSGVKVVAVIQGERTLSRGPSPRETVLFVDVSASPEQQQAAESLIQKNYADLVGKVIGAHPAHIQFSLDPERAAIRIKGLLELEMRRARLPEDALQGAISWYSPFVMMPEPTLATALHARYWGNEFKLRWSHDEPGTTGYYGSFSLLENH